MDYNGSKKHILELIHSEDFISSLNKILQPYDASITDKKTVQPKGIKDASEYGLQTLINKQKLSERFPLLKDFNFNTWWKPCGGKAPTWDMISLCQINGKEGILLVEAKAHKSELAKYGKSELTDKSSDRSRVNHENIKNKINEACDNLNENRKELFTISRDEHYQLSNRIAFVWQLKQLGVPVVLLYLGFTGDEYFKDKFKDEEHWKASFNKYINSIVPTNFIDNNQAEFIFIQSSLPIISQSNK